MTMGSIYTWGQGGEAKRRVKSLVLCRNPPVQKESTFPGSHSDQLSITGWVACVREGQGQVTALCQLMSRSSGIPGPPFPSLKGVRDLHPPY